MENTNETMVAEDMATETSGEAVAEPTSEEIIASLRAELEKATKDNGKLKSSFDKASADVSKYKKELTERMSESEREKALRDEEIETMKNEYEALKKEQSISTFQNEFLTLGYPQDLARQRAELLADGNIVEALEIEKQFIAYHDKALKEESIRNMERPPKGERTTLTREDIAKIKDADERQKAIAENYHLFKEN